MNFSRIHFWRGDVEKATIYFIIKSWQNHGKICSVSFSNHPIAVVIPAHNEEKSIAKVINDLPREMLQEIIVVDNLSEDRTKEEAAANGATVLNELNYGYGSACLRALKYLREREPAPEIVVFLDGDYSDHPEELPTLVEPLISEGFDLVIGSRILGEREKRALLPQQVLGSQIASLLIKHLYGFRFTDLGPFRAVKFKKLLTLDMRDRDYGWTAEMQVKAVKKKWRIKEVPVRYRRRIGRSKIAGTFKGTCLAAYKIITTILSHAFKKI